MPNKIICYKVVTKCGSFLLSQSAAKNCYKVRQLSLLQSAAKFVTKCGSCYKVRQNLLQSAAVVTKCGNCYKVEHNRGCSLKSLRNGEERGWVKIGKSLRGVTWGEGGSENGEF